MTRRRWTILLSVAALSAVAMPRAEAAGVGYYAAASWNRSNVRETISVQPDPVGNARVFYGLFFDDGSSCTGNVSVGATRIQGVPMPIAGRFLMSLDLSSATLFDVAVTLVCSDGAVFSQPTGTIDWTEAGQLEASTKPLGGLRRPAIADGVNGLTAQASLAVGTVTS